MTSNVASDMACNVASHVYLSADVASDVADDMAGDMALFLQHNRFVKRPISELGLSKMTNQYTILAPDLQPTIIIDPFSKFYQNSR